MKKNRKLAVIPLETGWHSDDQHWMYCEEVTNRWLFSTGAGRWCRLNASDITFKAVVYSAESAAYKYECNLVVHGRLEETDYSYYLLKFQGEKI